MLIKKLIFAPLFLILIAGVFYFFKFTLARYSDLFTGPWGGLYELGIIGLVLTGASLSFCLFLIFSQNAKFSISLSLAGSILSFIFLPSNLAIVTSICFFISMIITHFNLQTNLSSYVNFRADKILIDPVKTLSSLLLFSLSITFYLYSNTVIQTQGFKIPDSLMDWAIDLSLNQYNIPVKGARYLAQNPTQEQLDYLKQNPQLLEQFGLTPEDLNQIPVSAPNNKTTQSSSALPSANIKDAVKSQISGSMDDLIKPYLFAIPIILAFLFYSVTSFTMWIISFLLGPIISLLFYIFEKTGFITFQKEMREVKKMVV